VAFIAAIATRTRARLGWAILSVALVVAGAAIDLTFDTVHLTVIPAIARREPPDVALFLAVERMAWAVGAIVANGLYSAATLLVTLALSASRAIPRVAAIAGVGTFLGGALMCVAGFTGDPAHLELASAPTIAFFIAWTFTTSRALGRDETA
jgi:hypothetical protein